MTAEFPPRVSVVVLTQDRAAALEYIKAVKS